MNIDITKGLTSAQAAEKAANGESNGSFDVKTKSVGRIFRDNIFTLFNLINVILAALVAMGLSLLFFVFDKLGWINKEDAPEPENEFTVLADNIAAENARRDRESR